MSEWTAASSDPISITMNHFYGSKQKYNAGHCPHCDVDKRAPRSYNIPFYLSVSHTGILVGLARTEQLIWIITDKD